MKPPEDDLRWDPLRAAIRRRPYEPWQLERYQDQLDQLDRNHRAQQLATKIRAIRRPPLGTPDAGAPATGPAALRLPAGSENGFPATTTGSGEVATGVATSSGSVEGAPDGQRSGDIKIDLSGRRRRELLRRCEELGLFDDLPGDSAAGSRSDRPPGEAATAVTTPAVRPDSDSLWRF